MRKKTKQYQRAISGLGEAHDGSLRAENKLYEHKREALEQFLINRPVASFGVLQHLYANDLRRDRLAFVS